MATTNTIDIDQLQKQLAKAEKTNDTLKKQLIKLEKTNVNCTNEKSELLTKFKNASNLHGAQKDSIARWTGNYTRSDEENKKLLKENETLKKSHKLLKGAFHQVDQGAQVNKSEEGECTSLQCSVTNHLVQTIYDTSGFFGSAAIKLTKFTGNGINKSTIKYLENGMAVSDQVADSLSLDFAEHRNPVYKFGIKRAVDNYFNYKQSNPVKMPSEIELYKIMTNTHYDFYIQDKGTYVLLDLSKYMENYHLLPGYKYEVQYAEVDKQSYDFTFKLNPNSTDSYKLGDPSYDVAKYQFFSLMYLFFSAIIHSWNHFHFNTIVANYVFKMENQDSFLYKLLEPHVRFALAINQAVSGNESGLPQDYDTTLPIIPFNSFPVTLQNFDKHNFDRVMEFYAELNNGDSNTWHIPPRTAEFGYLKHLRDYYNVVEKFITQLKDYINEKELNSFASAISQEMPALQGKDISPISLLSTYIWQVSILHGMDHCTYYKGFYPFDIAPIKISIKDCDANTKIIDIVDKNFFLRSKNFLDIFAKYHELPEDHFTMKDLHYSFEDGNEAMQKLVQDFKNELFALDDKIVQENELMCPVSELPQSISF